MKKLSVLMAAVGLFMFTACGDGEKKGDDAKTGDSTEMESKAPEMNTDADAQTDMAPEGEMKEGEGEMKEDMPAEGEMTEGEATTEDKEMN